MYSNAIRSKRMFWYFLLLSFLFWVLPFMLWLFLVDYVKIEGDTHVKGLKIVSDIT